MLPWFLENYRKHNSDPIVFVNFGVSQDTLIWCKRNFDDFIQSERIYREREQYHGPAWWLKPLAIIETDAHSKVWIDTDCEVLGNISSIFDQLEPNKLNVAVDNPWTKRRGQVWHNTGVVGVIGSPNVLFNWYNHCRKLGGGFTFGSLSKGDQDGLYEMINNDAMKRWSLIHDLPNKYNWLRLQLYDGEDSPDKLIVHWTGVKGKDEIRKKING